MSAEPDELLQRIADYVLSAPAGNGEAMKMARYCLMDALGCGMQAFRAPQCMVFFNDGSSTRKIAVEYPIGDRHRRKEDLPRLEAKFKTNLACRYPVERQHEVYALLSDQDRLEATPVNELMDTLAA